MPGIAGFTVTDRAQGDECQVLVKMRDLMTHHDSYVLDALFFDKWVCATRCHTNVLQKEAQPLTRNEVSVWMDGEFYNRDEVAKEQGIEAVTDPQLLRSLYEKRPDLSLLKHIDGIFSAAIWDANRRQIHLVTDRYAFRQLYWTAQGDRLAWASEAKAMLGLPWFQQEIDRQALGYFLGIGHFIFDRTWLKGVRQLAPASVLSWDLRNSRLQTRRYWWWDEIKPLAGKADKRELAQELGRLFTAGVERRMPEGERVGIELSGGLDSRAIFAAMPERDDPIHAVTVGMKDSDEIRIASSLARVKKNAVHHAFEITAENWFMPRTEAVWQTDGCLSLRHMHDICLRGRAKSYYDVYFHGAGGGIVGGASLFEPTTEAFLASLQSKYHKPPDLMTPEFVEANRVDLVDYFEDLGSSHALYADWMVRSFTIHYLRTSRVDGVECRVPIFDRPFQELLFSIPLETRLDKRLGKEDALYKMMLLRTYPAYYSTIPYHKIGIPISWPDPAGLVTDAIRFARKTRNKIIKEAMASVGQTFHRKSGYPDYDELLRQEPARSFCEKLLTSQTALYAEYIPRQQVHELWRRHLNGERRHHVLCRYLTLELWLQQVFEGRYRCLEREESEVQHTAEPVPSVGVS
jgi:asparagine synthase (glutamine-hydrolysing)